MIGFVQFQDMFRLVGGDDEVYDERNRKLNSEIDVFIRLSGCGIKFHFFYLE